MRTTNPWNVVVVLLVVDHDGAVLAVALLFHQVEELEGVADGAVWIGPAGGGPEVFHIQNVVILLR